MESGEQCRPHNAKTFSGRVFDPTATYMMQICTELHISNCGFRSKLFKHRNCSSLFQQATLECTVQRVCSDGDGGMNRLKSDSV